MTLNVSEVRTMDYESSLVRAENEGFEFLISPFSRLGRKSESLISSAKE